jgi:hypothetical protein
MRTSIRTQKKKRIVKGVTQRISAGIYSLLEVHRPIHVKLHCGNTDHLPLDLLFVWKVGRTLGLQRRQRRIEGMNGI